MVGDVGRRNAGIVARREPAAVGQLDFELAQGLRPAVLPVDVDPLAQPNQSRIARILGAVGAEARRVDAGQYHRHRLAQAKFALQPVDRSGDIADPLAARVESQRDAGDHLRSQPMLLAQTPGAFDRRVRQITGGMVFEEVGVKVQPSLWRGLRGLGGEIRAVGRCKALDAFKNI